MRVALLLTLDRGGPVDLTVALASELARRRDGPEVVVVGPEPVSSTGALGALLWPVKVRSKTDREGFGAIRRVLDRLRPDVVHAEDRRAALVAAALRRRPWLFTYHGLPDESGKRWLAEGRLEGRRPPLRLVADLAADAVLVRLASSVTAPSADMARFLRRTLRAPASRVRHIANGIPLPQGPVRADELRPVRHFVTVGSFSPRKAVPLLVQAFAPIAARWPDARLTLVGDGPDRPRAEAVIAALGLQDRVRITGYRTDVGAYLAEADAFVLPSVNENLPLALLEALALGLPSVATAVGGVPEVTGDDGALLVPPLDAPALARAMGRLAENPRLAAAIGRRGADRVRQSYGIARAADAHVELWRSLCR
jgi:glycosyltransferase involved in cell wall biosynthesis